MLVIKRNKLAQSFKLSKLEKSIRKTFKSIGKSVDSDYITSIVDSLDLQDGMSTKDLQTQLENKLMEMGELEAARYLIIYRHINYHSKSMKDKVGFMRDYLGSKNAASGSKYDANANVTEKNLATLSGELFKGDVIKLNRYRLANKISEMYGEDLAKEYVRQLESHELYKHDESSILPYCTAISMYPFLMNGIKELGGLSASPKNLDSFCGMFCNLVFAVSAQFAGAVATGEFLMYFDYFARKDWGNDYWKRANEFTEYGVKLKELCTRAEKLFNSVDDINKYLEHPNDQDLIDDLKNFVNSINKNGKASDGTRTIAYDIRQKFQQIVYTINQPK